MTDDIMRTCRSCGEEWPATVEFFNTARNLLGEPYLRRVCKACQSERKRGLKVILGPCPCQGCRESVYLFRPSAHSGHPFLRWRNADGVIHRCTKLVITTSPGGVSLTAESKTPPARHQRRPTLTRGYTVPAVARLHTLQTQPSPPFGKASGVDGERRSTALPEPT